MPAMQINSCNAPGLGPELESLLAATLFAPLRAISLLVGISRSCLLVYSDETSLLVGTGCLVLAILFRQLVLSQTEGRAVVTVATGRRLPR